MDSIVFDEFESTNIGICLSYTDKNYFVSNIPEEVFYDIVVKVKYKSLICNLVYEEIFYYSDNIPISMFSFCKLIDITFKFKNKSEMIKFKLKYI